MCEESIESCAAELAYKCRHSVLKCTVGNSEFCPLGWVKCENVTSKDWIPVVEYEKEMMDKKQNIAESLTNLCKKESLDENTCPVKDHRICPFPKKECRNVTKEDWFEELFDED